MVKCLICGKIIWFWQLKGWSADKEELLIHKKCYAEQFEEDIAGSDEE
ncbi:hypothetical protein LCGC14_1402570 [marine sediment metagenome]|uniref:Uncharacterized protein n=1 Tax=marine sediment metagenome TaxID=412755 RepID=A0A0F9MC44_9ZZZZ